MASIAAGIVTLTGQVALIVAALIGAADRQWRDARSGVRPGGVMASQGDHRPGSPVGAALLGATADQDVEVRTPRGVVRYRVLEVR